MTTSAAKAAVRAPAWLAPCSTTRSTSRVRKYTIPSVATEPSAWT